MDNAGASVSSAADERGSDDEVKKLVRDRSLEAMFVDIPKVTHTHTHTHTFHVQAMLDDSPKVRAKVRAPATRR